MIPVGNEHSYRILCYIQKKRIPKLLEQYFFRLPEIMQCMVDLKFTPDMPKGFDNSEQGGIPASAVSNLIWFAEETFLRGMQKSEFYGSEFRWCDNWDEAYRFYFECLVAVSAKFMNNDLEELRFELEDGNDRLFGKLDPAAMGRLLEHPSWQACIYAKELDGDCHKEFNAAIRDEIKKCVAGRRKELLRELLFLATSPDAIDVDQETGELISETDNDTGYSAEDLHFLRVLLNSRGPLGEEKLKSVSKEIVTFFDADLMKNPQLRESRKRMIRLERGIRKQSPTSEVQEFLQRYRKEYRMILCSAAIRGIALGSRMQFIANYDNWPFINRLADYMENAADEPGEG